MLPLYNWDPIVDIMTKLIPKQDSPLDDDIYTVVELFLTLSKTLILALILILGGNQKHIYLRLKSILKFQGKFEH